MHAAGIAIFRDNQCDMGSVVIWRLYPHTHVNIELEEAVQRSLRKRAFMTGVEYKRYLQKSANWTGKLATEVASPLFQV